MSAESTGKKDRFQQKQEPDSGIASGAENGKGVKHNRLNKTTQSLPLVTQQARPWFKEKVKRSSRRRVQIAMVLQFGCV